MRCQGWAAVPGLVLCGDHAGWSCRASAVGVLDGVDDEVEIGFVEPGEGFTKIDGIAVGEAGCKVEDSSFPRGAGQFHGPEGSDSTGPVDVRQVRDAVGYGDHGVDETGEVGAVRPG